MEHLDISGKAKRKSKAQRLHMWRKREIQDIVEHQAHRAGIRVRYINPRNTSRLAFDGSGEVLRDQRNASLCRFTTGKQYNCDLNASYNIGARYFIREFLKPVSETERSRLWQKSRRPGVEPVAHYPPSLASMRCWSPSGVRLLSPGCTVEMSPRSKTLEAPPIALMLGW